MSAILARFSQAYAFFVSPSKQSRSLAESKGGHGRSSTGKGKGEQTGNSRFRKNRKAVPQDGIKGHKISKKIDKSTPSLKAKAKASKRKWNIPGMMEVYEQSQMSSTGENLEGETLIDDEPLIKCEDEDEGEGDATMVMEEDSLEPSQTTNNACLSFQDRILQRDDPRIEDWSEDEIWVFNKLVMRGHEPLLPYDLAAEFPSWPDILFSKIETKVVISNISRSTTNRTNTAPSLMCQANR